MTVDLAALAKLASEAVRLKAIYGRGNRRDDMDYVATIREYQRAASPDVVAALVRVALAARAVPQSFDYFESSFESSVPFLAAIDKLRAALADLDR